jgi:carbonic anhydrase
LIPKEFGTLKANVPAGSYVVVDDVKYNLLQFHFHQPSEHELNGNRSPMEAHFVHLRADTVDSRTPPPEFTDCRLVDRPVLVIGAFIVPGNADREIQKVFAPAVLPTDNTRQGLIHLRTSSAGSCSQWRKTRLAVDRADW